LTWRASGEQSTTGLSNDENFDRYLAVVTRGWTEAQASGWKKSMEAWRLRTSVDWSSVSSVQTMSAKTYGAADDVKRAILVNSQPAFLIFAPDAALATRIAYAMEFLRAACDRSAETGF
jgi:hypothetical protein